MTLIVLENSEYPNPGGPSAAGATAVTPSGDTVTWDGDKWSRLTSSELTALKGLATGAGIGATATISYDGSGRVLSAARTGRSYTYDYTASSYTITANDGALLTVSLDGSNRVIGLSGNF